MGAATLSVLAFGELPEPVNGKGKSVAPVGQDPFRQFVNTMNFSGLNLPQQSAVLHRDGPLLVLAGAGSGKTRVLTQRIIQLIRGGISAWNIFAVTFTNKAAREMKSRVVQELGPAAQSLWISTFHSSCLRLLRAHVEKIGYQPQFVIYDTSEQATVLKAVISGMQLNDKIFKPSVVASHIDRAKNAGQGPENYPTGGDPFLKRIAELYKKYQAELVKNQAMDFGDLILNVLRLFDKDPAVLAHYQNQFHYLFVDEYQDTNPVQYRLIRLLSQKYRNIFVVGDDDQSIYKFRGADVQIILNFKQDFPDAAVIRLEQNYRSTKTVLTVANAVIRQNASRLGKELWTENVSGEPVTVFHADDEKAEAIFVAGEVSKLKGRFPLSGMAIFYRTNAQSRSFEDELRRRGIPYRIFGGMRFYDRAEIKDVVSYLRLIVNRADGVALKRVINEPARGIGKTTIDKLEARAQQGGQSLWQVLLSLTDPSQNILPKATAAKILSFVALINELDVARKDLRLSEFLTHLYSKTGYWEMLMAERTVESESRKENLNEFVTVVEELMEENPELRLEEFLDQVSLASDLDKAEIGDEYVTLMTMHLSKGLEFDVVFLTGLEEGLFPHARSLNTEHELEEERRLCYVGMTRAKQRLFLSCAQMRHLFGAPQFNAPSRFLEDVPEELVQQVNFEAPPKRSRTPSAFSSVDSVSTQKPHSYIDRTYTQEEGLLRRGQRVSHAIFGAGQVQAWEGSGDGLKVTVRFQSGLTKKLVFKYANLHLSSQ